MSQVAMRDTREVTLPGDGVLVLECLAIVVERLASKSNVPPLEVVQDLYSLIAYQSNAAQSAEAGG